MVDQVLQALAEPGGREILKLIRLQEMSVGEIASHFDVTRPDRVDFRVPHREVVPNQRISFSFGWEGDNHPVPPGSTVVEITLTPDGDATIVRLEHSGLLADARADHGHGWQGYVDRLAAAAEGRDPGPGPNRIVASER